MKFVFILHVIVIYLLGLLAYHNIMRVQCSAGDSVNSREGGGGGGGGGHGRVQGGGDAGSRFPLFENLNL